MSRRVDPALTKQALAALKRAADKAGATPEGLSEWEAEFLSSLDERLKTYGSAFNDPDKGQSSAPLSMRQGLKVRQIAKKGDVKPKKIADPGKPIKEKKPGPKKPGKPLARKSGLVSKGFKSKRPTQKPQPDN
jgi:hypothetical protein